MKRLIPFLLLTFATHQSDLTQADTVQTAAISLCSALSGVAQLNPECFDRGRDSSGLLELKTCLKTLNSTQTADQRYHFTNQLNQLWQPHSSPLCQAGHLNRVYEQRLTLQSFSQGYFEGSIRAALSLKEGTITHQRRHIVIRTPGHGLEEPVLSKLFQPKRYTFAIAGTRNPEQVVALSRFFDWRTSRKASVRAGFSPNGQYWPESSANMVVVLHPNTDDRYWLTDTVNMARGNASELLVILKHSTDSAVLEKIFEEHCKDWELVNRVNTEGLDITPFSVEQTLSAPEDGRLMVAEMPKAYRTVLYFKRDTALQPVQQGAVAPQQAVAPQ